VDFAGVQIGKKFYLDPDSDTDSDPDKENTEGYLLVNLSGKVILIHTLLNIYCDSPMSQLAPLVKLKHPDSWKLLLLGFIGIGVEYYSHTSIPIVRRGGTPSEANPTK